MAPEGAPPLRPNVFPDGIPNDKTGGFWSASMHIFCAIVGAGVLALPSTFVALGWVAGPTLLVVFYGISVLTSFLQADVYQVDGVEFRRYHLLVRHVLSRTDAFVLSVVQTLALVFVSIAYTVSPAMSMRIIAQLACQYQDKDVDDCFDETWKMTLIFGAVQVPLSLLPNLESLWWVSGGGAIMSVAYASVALALGLKYAHRKLGTVGGGTNSKADKTFSTMNALGAIVFAYSFHVILTEVQYTIRQPARASKTMKRAIFWALALVFGYYLLIAVGGYASLGNDAPSYILAGFTEAPKWVMIMANVALVLHMLAAFQLYSQPMFEMIEAQIKRALLRTRHADLVRDREGATGGSTAGAQAPNPGSGDASVHSDLDLKNASMCSDAGYDEVDDPGAHPRATLGSRVLPGAAKGDAERFPAADDDAVFLPAPPPLADEDAHDAYRHPAFGTVLGEDDGDGRSHLPLPLTFATRAAYVATVTLIACCLPFFSDIAGLIGAIAFWPLSVYFPIQMWRKVYRSRGWFDRFLVAVNWSVGATCLVAIIGSVRGIIKASSNYSVFGDD